MYNLISKLPASLNLKNHLVKVAIIIAVFIFGGCHPSLKFATVTYDQAAVKKLLDSTNMDHIIFQFSSEEATSYKNPFLLIAYAFDSSNHLIDTIPYSLQKQEFTKYKSFTGKIILGNLTVSRAVVEEVITDDSTHTRNPFEFLRFVPHKNNGNQHVYYDMSAPFVSTMSRVAPSPQPIQPCPPAICF